MSVVSQLSTDLTNLVSESRRRNSEIKHASERSLNFLKSYNPSTDEQVFLKELSRNPDFITPFLLSCSSRNAKFSSIAIQSFQKLVQARSIPISKVDLLIEAFIEATHLAVDIQLKVLQILPTFFQIYGEFINNDLVAKSLLICSMLQSPSKIPMVINTAAATEQQLVLSLFDKVIEEDKTDTLQREFEVSIDDDSKLRISSSAYDVYRVFQDLCSLIEHSKPNFLLFNSMSELFGFELLENVLTNYKELFLSHTELGFLLRTRVTPLLLRSFSNIKDFSIVVRVSRIVLLLIRTQLSTLEIEAEVILSLFTHAISTESNFPSWKKIIALEIFHGVLSDFDLTKLIFATYDYDNEKKNIIYDFFNVCSAIVKESWASKLLDVSEIVSIPTSDRAITAQNAAPRVTYISVLDKTEAPPAPKTYEIYLIFRCITAFSDGIGKHLLDKFKSDDNTFAFLSQLSAKDQEEDEVLQLKSLITTNAISLVTIGTEFLYSSLGADLFHILVRSLQRLCHASGVLGLTNQRNSLLLLFSIATISNLEKQSAAPRSNTIGETLAETLTSSVPSSSSLSPINISPHSRFQQRYLNSRHVICFRVLISLTISLGPNFKDSWKFILITFQWFDYYVNGPSDYLSFKDIPPKPDLSLSDIKLIESSFQKLVESTKGYDSNSYNELLNELVKLSRTVSFEEINTIEPIVEDEFSPCSFNRDFFTVQLGEISKLNVWRYLEDKGDENWDSISKFLSDVVTSSSAISELRIIACNTHNNFIKELAREGFSTDSNHNKSFLETKLFKSLSNLNDRMLSSHSGEQFSQTESEMIHDTLKTLFELLDRFGTSFTHSWAEILHIINSPFKFFEISKHTSSQNQLLKSSFEILQLVLSDFLQAIPLEVLQIIIDVLKNFCTQDAELNVSFSAVSYYWLISDYFRQQVTLDNQEVNFDVTSFDELPDLIKNNDNGGVKLHSLWLYLLHSLVKISSDPRTEVRNGAIQTFFRIVDSHGTFLNWDRTFNVVVKDLLVIDFDSDNNEKIDSKQRVESILIILRGVSELYSRFLIQSQNPEIWKGLTELYSKLVKLDIIEVSTNVYRSFNELLKSVQNLKTENFELFFNFWSKQSISYVSSDTDALQNPLVEMIGCFSRLYTLSSLTRSQLEVSLSIFNNAIRFPFLPGYTSDVSKPTKLQTSVLEALDVIEVDVNHDLTFSFLSSFASLPFQTRSRILKKLPDSRKKNVPSFIAASLRSVEILKAKWNTVEDFKPLVSDKTITKVLKILYDSTTTKIDDDHDHLKELLKSGLWKGILEVIISITTKVVPLLNREDTDKVQSSHIWEIIINSSITTLPIFNSDKDESFNVEQYQNFKSIIVDNLNQDSLTSDLIEKFVSSIWRSSLLYESDELETFLLETSETPNELTEIILNTSINDYTTEPLKVLSQQKFRLLCLNDLFDLTNFKIRETKLIQIVLPFLVCRLVLGIRKLSGTQKLVNQPLITTVQERELILSLQKLKELLSDLDKSNIEDYRSLLSVFPLILDNNQYISNVKQAKILTTGITSEFYKISQLSV